MNLYVIRAAVGLVCVDAGWRPRRVTRDFESLGLNPQEVVAVFLTHLHWDHAQAVHLFSNAKVFIGEREIPERAPRWLRLAQPLEGLREGESTAIAGLNVRVVDTPGHSPGSVSYVFDRRFLFTGDALRLRRGEARPFLSFFNQDHPAHIRSIRKLAGLDGLECLFTGHSGISRDVGKTFRRWRKPVTGGQTQGGDGP